MNIETLKEQGFTIKQCTIGGEDCVLVVGNGFGINWTKENLIYRSSIWTIRDDRPISLSFKKFFNWGEQSILIPEPDVIKSTSLLSKIDGSAFIISKFKGELITRTRGTISIEDSDFINKDEVIKFQQQYPKLFNNELVDSEEYSIVCEWYSPNNIIVLNYGEQPKLFLTGIIRHWDYSYLKQDEVDKYGKEWDIERPEYFTFNNISSMIDSIKALKDKEGVCVYFNQGQDIKKLKSLDYLAKHAFKSNMTLDNLIELFIKFGYPAYNDFYNNIMSVFDFECAKMALPLCSKISDGMKEVNKIIEHMKDFIGKLKGKSRKEAAMEIIKAYGATNRSAFVFSLLDGKQLKDEQIKKILFQVIR